MVYHIIAFLLAFILDAVIGDPHNFPHPIRLIGKLISSLEKRLLNYSDESNRNPGTEKRNGLTLCVIVVLLTLLVTSVTVFVSYSVNKIFGVAVEAVLMCYTFAARSLVNESKNVAKKLDSGIESGRKAVSMIVGRDTDALDEKGVIKATVETIAENTSDGVIAPLLCAIIGGPVLSMTYKAINTMDSMIGYHNDRYENFGFYAAKLDDVVNYIPSRLSAYLLIASAYLFGEIFEKKPYDYKEGLRIFKRDRFNHKSPNSAQTESAVAGILGLQLAGDAYYFGKLMRKPTIGDNKRSIEKEDINRTNRLMYCSAFTLWIAGSLILTLFL